MRIENYGGILFDSYNITLPFAFRKRQNRWRSSPGSASVGCATARTRDLPPRYTRTATARLWMAPGIAATVARALARRPRAIRGLDRCHRTLHAKLRVYLLCLAAPGPKRRPVLSLSPSRRCQRMPTYAGSQPRDFEDQVRFLQSLTMPYPLVLAMSLLVIVLARGILHCAQLVALGTLVSRL